MKLPVQERSRASLERVLVAVEELIVERGGDDFTMQDVAKRAKLAVGSIYSRFQNKNALMHIMQARVLERLDIDLRQRTALVRAQARDLSSLVAGLVEALAETLKTHANLMLPFMDMASADPVIAENGKRYHAATADCIKSAMHLYGDEIPSAEVERVIGMAFTVLYSVIARYLGYGSSQTGAREGDWEALKTDLAKMLSVFLKTP
ncbi:MAG TPA: TetR/AcrR family transcriptional regulator [Novosphingobium sp.]|nr:TetR/AcrR family transcriptional regulator [Novosphingobium sp.]